MPVLEYANRHIPAFLALPETLLPTCQSKDCLDAGMLIYAGMLQIAPNGALVTAANYRSEKLSLTRPLLVTDTPTSIGMRLPRPKKGQEAAHVRDIADIVGHYYPVNVIDVEHQEELDGWTFADLVDYFEDEERIAVVRHGQQEESTTLSASLLSSSREGLRRKASVAFINKTRHRVLNQISFEFSNTNLLEKVRSPQFVRELDWIDNVWPDTWRHQRKLYPAVQYYCLTSAAGCYTDFHLDFGGTSVWYHVLSGSKEFVLIEPTQENLKVYEEWLCRKDQAQVFLPTMLPESTDVLKIRLEQDQTFIIPSGWIHAVYTPEDSLVFGGNFLHGLDMSMQLTVNSIEVRTRVLERFRFPFFIPTQYYAAGVYLGKLCKGNVTQREVDTLPVIMDALEQWWNGHATLTQNEDLLDQHEGSEPSIVGAALYAARSNGCDTVEEFLLALRREHARVVRDGVCPASDTVTSSIWIDPVQSNSSATNSTQSPRVGLKCAPASKGDTTTSPTSFRIKLSSKARDHTPIPMQRIRPREDVASFVDEKEVLKDDEWRPSSGLASTGSKRKQQGSGTLAAARSPRIRIRLTARDRLLKKAKF